MKLNNRGWGLNTLLICIVIILTALVFCVYYVSKLYNEIDKKLYQSPAVEDKVIDNKAYYLEKVALMNDATNKFITDNNIKILEDEEYEVVLDDLISSNYIDSIKDLETGNDCIGYSIVTISNDIYGINSFIKCDNYTSIGYGDK